MTESSAEPAWHVNPSLSISETYNSNIYSRSDETEDFITGIGARLNTSYTGANAALQADYAATMNAYAHYPELNVVTHDGSINIDMARWFSRSFRGGGLSVSEEFTYTPDLRDYSFDAESGGASLSNYGIRTGRNDSFRNAASIAVRFSLSRHQDLNLKYSTILTEFSDPLLIDNIANSMSIGTSYLIRRNTLNGDFGIRNSTTDDEDLNSYFIIAGLRHMFSTDAQGVFRIGLDMIDHETMGHTSNVRGELSFSKTSESLSYQIGYSRELNTVSGISTAPVVSQVVYTNLSDRHTRRLSSNIKASYAKNSSLNGSQVDIQSYNISAGATYAIRAWLTGSFSVSHLVQDSEVTSAQDIERNLIMFQVSASRGAVWGL